MLSPPAPPSAQRAPIGLPEFVALMAGLMSINALGVDSMLPALPEIAQSIGINHENQRQWIVSAYMLGFGSTQIIYGPLADRFGRRPVVLAGLFLFAATNFVASFASSFTTMILARFLQGVAAAATRVLAVAIIRDKYSGREMARVMSLTTMIFIGGPIVAPAVGQLIITFAAWHAIFDALALFALMLAAWLALRLGETLHPEYRRPISARQIFATAKQVVRDRCSLGYTLALTLTYGGLMGYINSAQQIFADALGAPELFALMFAFSAGGIALAALINSQIVMRFGTRRVSHLALLGFIATSALHVAWAVIAGDTILSFALFQFAQMICFGLTNSNFSAMAMENMGAVAGTAASIQGTMSILIGSLIGITIGQSFDNSTLPVALGFLASGVLSLALVLATERGKLFRPQHGQ